MLFRPRIVVAFVIIVFACFTPSLNGQAMAVVPSSGSVSTLPSEPVALPTNQTTVSLDVSTLGWQMGQLSPYGRFGLIGSSTSNSIVVDKTPAQATINPFLGSAIGMNGGLTTKVTPSTNGSTNFVPVTLQGVASTTLSNQQSSFSFGPRFLSYAPLAPDYGLIPTMDHSDPESTSMYNQSSSSGADISRLASVPEPGTFLLCGGLLAVIGYGWAQRKQKEKVMTEKKTEVAAEVA